MATTIDQLLFAELPDVPWRDGQAKELQAVIMLQPYAYDDTAAGVPASIRNRVHDSLKINNLLHLYVGEQGLLYDTNPTGTKGAVLFIKGAKEVLAIVPMNLLNLGSKFRTLEQKTVSNLPTWLPRPSSISVANADNVFDATLRTFWNTMSKPEHFTKLQSLSNCEESLFKTFSNLSDNVGSIENALLPNVRRVIQSGTFSLRDLISLHQVDAQSHFPPERSVCIYMRLYIKPQDRPGPFLDATQADYNRDVGIYIGQTVRIAHRMREHDSLTLLDTTNRHYARAVKSLPEDRFAIPLLVWDDTGASSELIDMAEQTMVLFFWSYQRYLFLNSTPPNRNTEGSRLFSSVFTQVSSNTGWPRLRPFGLNTQSPLLSSRTWAGITCIPMAPGDPGTRTFTTYRIRRNVRTTSKEYQVLRISFFVYGVSLVVRELQFYILNKRLVAQRPRQVYLVFEVMNDNRPHPRPWVGVPSVGPFKNFEQASSLGIRVEWQDESTHRWFTAPLRRQGPLRETKMRKILENDDQETFLASYRDPMLIIQCLKKMDYTGPLNGHPSSVTLGKLSFKVLETDHLSQTYRLVDQPRTTCPAPTMSEWEENYNLMVQEYASEATRVGLSTPPQLDDESMLCGPRDVLRAGLTSSNGSLTHMCDTCKLINTASRRFTCERDPSDPRGCCKVCALLNRPCTYTATSVLSVLVGNRKPWAHDHHPFCMYPHGPFRALYYYAGLSPDDINEVQFVSTPIEKRLEFSKEDIEESDSEEEEEQADMEELVEDEEELVGDEE
ncbi:hypothetical protein ACHAPI_010300 [Fusarium lateritium]